MNTEKIQGSGQLYCMNGMRFLTMTWIIIGHTEDSYTLLSWTNYIDDFNRNPASLALEPIYGFNFSVDTFFFMSGCLVAYITFQQLDALKDSSTGEWLKYWSLFYLHRLWRLTFPYLFVVTFTATWGEFLEFGPLKYITVFGREMCQSLWFRNLLYVNNFWTSKPDEREYTEYFYHYVYDRNYQVTLTNIIRHATQTPLNKATLGPAKSGSNNRLALFSEIIHIILLIRTTKGGSFKRSELITGELLTEVYCIIIWILCLVYRCILVFIDGNAALHRFPAVHLSDLEVREKGQNTDHVHLDNRRNRLAVDRHGHLRLAH